MSPFGLGLHQRTMRGVLLLLFLFNGGCATSIEWVPDSLSTPSCIPNRLPQWSDYGIRIPQNHLAAETAVHFILFPPQRIIRVVFDSDNSWVKAELVNPQNSAQLKMSERLLVHEQVHFMISCLVTRQANLSLLPGDDPVRVLEKTKSEAQRINLQYDAETRHGTIRDLQRMWEKKIMEKFKEQRLAKRKPNVENFKKSLNF
jgi:hypothetical protein